MKVSWQKHLKAPEAVVWPGSDSEPRCSSPSLAPLLNTWYWSPLILILQEPSGRRGRGGGGQTCRFLVLLAHTELWAKWGIESSGKIRSLRREGGEWALWQHVYVWSRPSAHRANWRHTKRLWHDFDGLQMAAGSRPLRGDVTRTSSSVV